MYLSPWTGAKYLWAVAETVGGLNGYRTSGRPHLAPLRPKDWTVGGGGARALGRPALHLRHRSCASDTIYARYAGAFGRRTVYVHLCRTRRERRGRPPRRLKSARSRSKTRRAPCASSSATCSIERRDVLLEFRGHTARVAMAAGELREVHLIGKPSDRRARAAKLDVVRPLARV